MKKIIPLISLLTIICFVSGIFSQTQPSNNPGPQQTVQSEVKSSNVYKTPVRSETKQLNKTISKVIGEVVSIDATANTITLKKKSGENETLSIDPKVVVKKSGKICSLSDITVGERIVVSYQKEGDKKVAKVILVSVPPVKKEKGPEKK